MLSPSRVSPRITVLKSTSRELTSQLLQLRIAVAFLGEKDQFGWWSTQFLAATGQRFLGFAFPRSAFAAGVTSASKAAKKLHDKRIGQGGVVHLFRLPHVLEEQVHDQLISLEGSTLQDLIVTKNKALETLSQIGGDVRAAPNGPIRVGHTKLIYSSPGISKTASLYLDAFKTGKQTLPYFADE